MDDSLTMRKKGKESGGEIMKFYGIYIYMLAHILA